MRAMSKGVITTGLSAAAALLLVAALCASRRPEPPETELRSSGDGTRVLTTIREAGPRAGDLLFRRGRSVLSRAVLAADEGGAFSHVGIVVETPDGPGVVHTVAGEDGAEGGARRDALADFLAPGRARDAALYRLAPDGAGNDRLPEAAAEVARDYAVQGVPFDGEFDLTSDERLYCTELVWAAFRSAGADLADGRFDTLDAPFAGGEYLFPSRLAASPRLRLLATTRP